MISGRVHDHGSRQCRPPTAHVNRTPFYQNLPTGPIRPFPFLKSPLALFKNLPYAFPGVVYQVNDTPVMHTIPPADVTPLPAAFRPGSSLPSKGPDLFCLTPAQSRSTHRAKSTHPACRPGPPSRASRIPLPSRSPKSGHRDPISPCHQASIKAKTPVIVPNQG